MTDRQNKRMKSVYNTVKQLYLMMSVAQFLCNNRASCSGYQCFCVAKVYEV